MQSLKWLLLAVIVVAGLALATVYKSRLRSAKTEVAAPAPPPAVVEPAEPPMVAPEPAPAAEIQPPEAMASAPAEVQSPMEPSPQTMVLPVEKLDADMVLATVNGTAIKLGDLMAVNPSVATQQSIRADAYENLLNQAIERELTFQAAKGRGVELNELQQRNLEEVRAAALARAGAPYMPADYDAEAQAAFEVRVGTAQLLQNFMLGKADPPATYITLEQVQEYYGAHPDEFEALPKDPAKREQAWAPIEEEIRNRLISKVYIQHERDRKQMLEELKAAAAIQQLVGPPGK